MKYIKTDSIECIYRGTGYDLEEEVEEETVLHQNTVIHDLNQETVIQNHQEPIIHDLNEETVIHHLHEETVIDDLSHEKILGELAAASDGTDCDLKIFLTSSKDELKSAEQRSTRSSC